MLLELRKLMTSPGETLPFETSVDLSDMPFGGCKPVTEPVLAKGQVRNTAGVRETVEASSRISELGSRPTVISSSSRR